ncbi:uncharacterized protein KY384_004445 [Bacidia gigantensis]|uniref:uncharacterized protein n=1 Tax=Bacidia gigantensis TaxID=2732470 RepID=UPI001D03A1C6|nr:uncharacterized protein KY384_004445 [Bacidia gigantensis]KAG8531088.1 hypothetical protein KY384_004445 [Bacidia gigantensis]
MENATSDISETPNQRQARLRLTPEPPPLQPSSTPSHDPSDASQPQPEASTPPLQAPSEADFSALLRSATAANAPDQQTQQSQEEDPMMKMLAQLMGGLPSGGVDGGGAGGLRPDGGLPPGLAAMMGGVPPAQSHGQPQRGAGAGVGRNDYVWKIVHAIFAFALAIYVALATTAIGEGFVAGRIAGRSRGEDQIVGRGQGNGSLNLFWAFATIELVLQSARYFLEMGRTGSPVAGGIVGMVMGLLPQPYKGWLDLLKKYSGIWSTIVEDGCVIVFVVGWVSWWRGAVG